MGLTSLQACMDSPNWFHLQGTMQQEDDESSSGGGDMDMLTCTRPSNMTERRLRPPQDQALKCPRCESTHTKFCYYNNYSLSQPRYFCKTCRRYWTKGGTLRNIPVGGGCRKTSKKPNNNNSNKLLPSSSSADQNNINQTNLLQLSYLNNSNFMEQPKYNISGGLMMEGIASSRNINVNNNSEFMSNYFHFGMGQQDHYNLNNNNNNNNYNVGGSYGSQRVMLPYEDRQSIALMDVKPNMLSLDWHDQNQQGRVCTDNGKDSFGYNNVNDGIGSNWGGGMINGYGSSTANHHLM